MQTVLTEPTVVCINALMHRMKWVKNKTIWVHATHDVGYTKLPKQRFPKSYAWVKFRYEAQNCSEIQL